MMNGAAPCPDFGKVALNNSGAVAPVGQRNAGSGPQATRHAAATRQPPPPPLRCRPRRCRGDEFAMTTLRTAAITLCLFALAVLIVVPAHAADALGVWYTAEQKSQVRITNCGGALCGALIWLKEPNDPDTGRP